MAPNVASCEAGRQLAQLVRTHACWSTDTPVAYFLEAYRRCVEPFIECLARPVETSFVHYHGRPPTLVRLKERALVVVDCFVKTALPRREQPLSGRRGRILGDRLLLTQHLVFLLQTRTGAYYRGMPEQPDHWDSKTTTIDLATFRWADLAIIGRPPPDEELRQNEEQYCEGSNRLPSAAELQQSLFMTIRREVEKMKPRIDAMQGVLDGMAGA